MLKQLNSILSMINQAQSLPKRKPKRNMFAFDSKQLLGMLQDKKNLIKGLIDIINRQHKQDEGLKKLRESITREEDPNHSQANLIKCLESTMMSASRTSGDVKTLAILVLVYAQSNSMDGDVAKLLNKMGKGEEALRAMMDSKLK